MLLYCFLFQVADPLLLPFGVGGGNGRGGLGFPCSRLGFGAVVAHHLFKLLGVRIVVFVVTGGRPLV